MVEVQKTSAIVILALAMLAGPASVARASPDPVKAEQFIRDRIAQSMILFTEETPSRALITRRIRGELNENFDIHSIAAYALGPLRTNLSADQKQRYLGEFKDWLTETITRFVMGLRNDMPAVSPDIVRLTGTTPLGRDQIIVHSRIRQSDTMSAHVDWRLRQKGDRFLVLDIMVFGVSQAKVFRSQFAALVSRQNRDIEGLIAELKEKNSFLSNQQ